MSESNGTPRSKERIKHGSLAEAKLAVMRESPYLLKTKSRDLGYAYASEEALIEELHDRFVEHGLTISPIDANVEVTETFTTKKGTVMNRLVLKVVYELTHADTGQTQRLVAIGEGADVGDKGSGKAMTGALKYAVWQCFFMQRGTDPDKVASDEMEREDARRREEDAERERSFGKVKDHLYDAADVRTLERYRDAYRSRNFTPDQIEALDRIYDRQRDALQRPKERTS